MNLDAHRGTIAPTERLALDADAQPYPDLFDQL